LTIEIRPEADADRAAVWNVHRAAFPTEAEANLVDALRDGGYGRVSLAAEQAGLVVGHIFFSDLPIHTAAGTISALSLAPMAVLPEHQRRGVGSRLVAEGLLGCRQAGQRIVLVLGHPEFYPRFGFSAELAKNLESPFGGGEAWMALELVPGALAGVQGRVEYPPPFGELG
jgi:putative acetyltransferase